MTEEVSEELLVLKCPGAENLSGELGLGMKASSRGQQLQEKLENGGVYVREGSVTGDQKKKNNHHITGTILAVLIVAALSVILGLLVGQTLNGGLVSCESCQEPLYDWGDTVLVDDQRQAVTAYLASKMSADAIKDNLRMLTEHPHIAGSKRNYDLAVTIYNQWKEFGFDSVDIFNYSVLLSYPDSSAPNTLTLRQADSELIYDSHIAQEPPLTSGENSSDVAPPFNAYSGSGNVSGPLVYVNFGSLKDFKYLTNSSDYQLDLTRYICIARYGSIFRGIKALLAQQFGCKGLIIYSDPDEYAPEGVPVHPDGPSLPPYGVQRGSLQSQGDPLTPGYPSLAGVYRRPYSEAVDEESVPRIPVQPISYGDAAHFMEQLTEHPAPSHWVGGLGIQYNLLQSPDNANYTQLVVNNYQEQRNISNVVAKIYGSIEPDRQVILGNHRDAWVFGAGDPSSGTAALMNAATALGELRKANWRPGRTITLCSWDAEEYGLIGSTEWVEAFAKLLGSSTLAYLNLDVAVSGNHSFSAEASPLLYETIWEATKMVDDPKEGHSSTVYDAWLGSSRAEEYLGVDRPRIGYLGSGSDFASFSQRLGISCSDMGYAYRGPFPVYHSIHDNFDWISRFADPDFTYHLAVAEVWAFTALLLSSSPIPPVNFKHFGEVELREWLNYMEHFGNELEEQEISWMEVTRATHEFSAACSAFQASVEKVMSSTDISKQLSVSRMVIDRMMQVERAFIRDEGLPGRPLIKNVLIAPSSSSGYGAAIFPALVDATLEARDNGGSWDAVRQQLDVIRIHSMYASQILQEPVLEYARP